MDDTVITGHPQPGQPLLPDPAATGLRAIAGYELLAKLGKGGMGTVFKARQRSMDRVVALKVLPPHIARDPKFIERFVREARASARLSHPNIVQGIDVAQDPATKLWYFAMEFVDGPNLKQLITRDGPFAERRALEICRDVARALEEAARQGIVHRDIKPDNILISSRGVTKLADLGLAKHEQDDASLTQAGQSLGTPLYMAPEQIRGRLSEIDPRTDLYALGATLFHLLTGKPPFRGETSAVVMAKHLGEPPPRADAVRSEISSATSALIVRLMAKARADRVGSPAELVRLIDGVLAGRASGAARSSPADAEDAPAGAPARRPHPAAPSAHRPGRGRLLALAGGIGALALALAGALALTSGRPSPAPASGPEPVPPATPTGSASAAAATPPAERVPTDLRQMLAYVQDWERRNPQAFAEIAQRYAKVAKQAEGTPLEIELCDEIDLALEAMRERQRAATTSAWEPIVAKARALAAAGDVDAALAAATPPPDLAKALAADAAALAKELRGAADARIAAAVAKAEDSARRAEPAEGLAALDALAGMTYAPGAARLAAARQRLVKEQADAAALGERRARLAAEQSLAKHLAAFDEALIAKGDLTAARVVAIAADADPALAALPAARRALGEVLAAYDAELRRQQDAAEALKGRRVTIGSDTGTVLAVADGALSLEITLGTAVAVKKVRLAELSAAQRQQLVPPSPAPATAAERIAAVTRLLRDPASDPAAVGALLSAAGDHPLVAHYHALAASRQEAAREHTAEQEWAAVARAAAAASTPPAAEALRTQLAAWSARHGGSRFAAAHHGDLAAWQAKADALAAPSLLRNPSFENGLDGWVTEYATLGYDRTRSPVQPQVRDDGARHGRRCAAIAGDGNAVLAQAIEVSEPTALRLTGWVRWLTRGQSGMRVRVRSDGGRASTAEAALEPAELAGEHGAGDWQRFAATVTLPRPGRWWVMVQRRSEAGDCLFDNLDLQRVTSPAAQPARGR